MKQSDSEFLFSMKDGSTFDYSAYIKQVWSKSIQDAGLPHHVGILHGIPVLPGICL